MEDFKISRYDGFLLFVALVWGAQFGIVKTAVHEVHPLAFGAFRLIVGSLAMLLVLYIHEKRFLLEGGKVFRSRADLRVFIGLSFLIAGNYILFIWGLAYTTTVNSSILYASSPVILGTLSFLKQRQINRLAVTGLALASAGVLLVIAGPHGLTLSASTLKGDIISSVAVTSWALYPYFGSAVLDRYSAIRVTAYSMIGAAFIAAISCFPAIVGQAWGSLSWVGWAGLLYSTLLAVVVCLALWSYSISKIGPLKVMAYQYLVPVIAFILALVLWKESVYPVQALGGLLVLAGVRFVRVS